MSSKSGTTNGYSIEARYNFNSPHVINGHTLDKEWRTIAFDTAPSGFGIPSPPFEFAIVALGLYGYSQAQALRWWFHANADATFHGICLETRIVKHTVKYSIEAERKSEHLTIGGEDRSNCMPDWGVTEKS